MNQEEKKKRFDKIIKDIKEIKIQGATNVAKASLRAYFILPGKKSKKMLLESRPTEPMMQNVLEMAEKYSRDEILKHFDFAQGKINKVVFRLIKNKDIIFTHCYSTNVNKALIHAHKKGKKFEVYATETRPLFQGRKTACELRKSGIKVAMFVDSAMGSVLSKGKESGLKKVSSVFIGADALLKNGIINKIGSELVAHLAKEEKIPVYIIADSWKFTNEKVPIEQRALNEVWDRAPKNIKIKNPAFELVPKKYIKAIVSELGVMKYDEFLKKCKRV